jgi:hypothetical protein
MAGKESSFSEQCAESSANSLKARSATTATPAWARMTSFPYILSHSAGIRRGGQLLEDRCFSRPDDHGGET